MKFFRTAFAGSLSEDTKKQTVGEDGWFGSTVTRSGTADFADMRRGICHDSDISDKLVS